MHTPILLRALLLATASATAMPVVGARPRHPAGAAAPAATLAWKGGQRAARLVGARPCAGPISARAQVRDLRIYPPARHTVAGLIALRRLHPARFDRAHCRTLIAILERDMRLAATPGADCRALNGLLAPTARIRYLKYLRGLNPGRFDRYNPIVGAILAEDDRLRRGLVRCPAASLPPPLEARSRAASSVVPTRVGPRAGGGGHGGGGGGKGLASVPEPTS